MATARKALDEVGDYAYQGRTLNDVAEDIRTRGKIAVIIDPGVNVFGIENMPIVNVNLKGTYLLSRAVRVAGRW